jgi:hypothetical protein
LGTARFRIDPPCVTRVTNNLAERAHTHSRADTMSRLTQRGTAMTDFASIKNQALTSDELDRVAGGIIIVGGLQRQFSFTSVLDRVALNPQPLPPKVFSFGRH